jgi:hypothetical protein
VKYSESEIKNDNFTVKLSFLFNSKNSVILRYTRNTSLMEEIVNPATSFYILNQDLDTLNKWSKQWIVTFNASKTEFLTISKKSGRAEHVLICQCQTCYNCHI